MHRDILAFVLIASLLVSIGACVEPIPADSSCGDGTVQVGEQCDEGSANGIICTPETTCTYCTTSCEEHTLTNAAPIVDAGPDQVTGSGSVTLHGTVSDDGYPDALTAEWSAHEDVVFTDASQPRTNITFSSPGTYVLELTASDGVKSDSDTARIVFERPDDTIPTCFDGTYENVVELTGTHTNEYDKRDTIADGTLIDARNGTFLAPAPDDPVTIHGTESLCWHGGVIDVGIADDEPDWEVYHHSQGIYLRDVPNAIVESVAVFHTGDGIRFTEGSPNWTLRDSYFQHTGDDAVENDLMYTGTIERVLFDWSYVAFSCRLGSGSEGLGYSPGGTMTIRDSLVALKPQVGVYKDESPGYGRFFKWEKDDQPGCTLVLENNVFLAEDAANFADLILDPSDDTDVIEGLVLESRNNTIVWTGGGAFPRRIPEGWTLTTDRSVWENARARWFSEHPEIVEAIVTHARSIDEPTGAPYP